MARKKRRLSLSGLFDHQVEMLVRWGYPALPFKKTTRKRGMGQFNLFLNPLKQWVKRMRKDDYTPGNVPFLIVFPNGVLPIHLQMSRVMIGGNPGHAGIEDKEYQVLDELEIPEQPYLAVDVNTGEHLIGVGSQDCADRIIEEGRSPGIIEEGVSLVTHYPKVLFGRRGIDIPGAEKGFDGPYIAFQRDTALLEGGLSCGSTSFGSISVGKRIDPRNIN